MNRPAADMDWHRFTPEELEELREEDKPPGGWDAYALVKYARGERYKAREIKDHETLDPRRLAKSFVQDEYGPGAKLDGMQDMAAGCEAEITIYTDGRPPFSAVCWTSRGFFTTTHDHAKI